MRKLNLLFLMGVVMALLVLSGATYLVHGRQVERNASALLDRARKAEEQGEGSKASEALRHYLTLRPADGETWRWYARVLDEVTADSRRRDQVYLAYEEALRYNSGDPALERRCVDLALELRPERTADAKRHLEALLALPAEKLKKNPEASNAARELAELNELKGKCLFLESDFEAAANAYNDAISYDPTRLACYVQRARLDRNELRKDPKDADDEIERMVANNPESGPAHLYRFRYASEFQPPAHDSDLKKALELSPDDPEVLLTAAPVAEQKRDPTAARAYLEKGLKLHPQNADFPMALAWLELGEQHPDRAEAVLRQAYQTKPSADLAFLLAETLILEDKDGASVFMEYLADRGYRETYVRYLEARIEVQKKRWDKAISKIESARAVLKGDPQVSTQLNLMLAECYSHLGWDEQRLVALRNAGEGQAGSEAARLALARSLAESGKVDEALAMLLPLADGRPELRFEIARLSFQKTLRQPVDQRNWTEVEKRLGDAEKARPEDKEAATLLRADLLTGKGQISQARSLLSTARTTDPKNLNYRVALARLADIEKKGAEALEILDQAEKDLGPSLAITLARLDHWVQQGGAEAKAAVAKLAETRLNLTGGDLPIFLDRLAAAEIRLGEPALARKCWSELSALQPDNLRVLMGRFELALAAHDQAETRELVERIRKGEGEQGTSWRFAQAASLIDQARSGDTKALNEAGELVGRIAELRPGWWGAPLLDAQIAEFENQPDRALASFLAAVRLGNDQTAVIRRLLMLLNERRQFDEVDRLAQMLRDRGVAIPELTVVNVINAMRAGDYNQGLTLARQVFPESSTIGADHLALGRLCLISGQTEEAGKHYKRAVELEPAAAYAWLTYVQYLAETKQAGRAKAAVEDAAKALPADRSSLTLAQCLMMIGEPDRAEALIRATLKESPDDPSTLRAAAGLLFDRGKTDEAGKMLEALSAPAPGATREDLAWANRTRATILTMRGRPADLDQALPFLDHNLREQPNSVEDLRVKASILARRPNRHGEAIKILEPLSSANLLEPRHRFTLAQLYLAAGEPVRYQGEMLKLLDMKVKDPEHLAHYVAYLLSRNQAGQAQPWLAMLEQLEPRTRRVLELKAYLLKALVRQPEVVALLEGWLRQNPDQIGFVATLLDRFGFAREAEAAHKAYVAGNPKDPERLLPFAEFLARQGRHVESLNVLENAWKTCRPEAVASTALAVYGSPSASDAQKLQAVRFLDEALKRRPDDSVLQARLAAVYIREGRAEEAEVLDRRVLEIDPENIEALNNLAWLLALRDPSDTEQALDLIDRAIEAGGRNPSLMDTRAVILIRAGRTDDAIKELETAMAFDRQSSTLALHLGWAYQAGGRTEDARRMLDRARELGLKSDGTDPLERAFITKLRQQFADSEPAAHAGPGS